MNKRHQGLVGFWGLLVPLVLLYGPQLAEIQFKVWEGSRAHERALLEGSEALRGLRATPFAAGDTLPAFPEAEGRGAIALHAARESVLAEAAGWSFEIHIVDDTSASGPGTMDSVRTVILADATAYHLVVFNVSGGWTPSGGEFNLTNMKNVYIACQTAPGSGFRFRSVWKRGDADSPDDFVARYCHLKPTGSSSSMLQLWSARRFIFDHGSVMFNSSDDLFEFYGQQDGTNTWTHEDITVSYSIIGVGVTSGATGLAYHNDDQAADSRWGIVDAHHNVMAHLQNRAPKCNIDGTDNLSGCKFVSNYSYNIAGQAYESNDTARVDYIQDVADAGPSWDTEKDRFFVHDTSSTQSDDPNPADIYFLGSRVENGPTGWDPPLSQDSLFWSMDQTKLGGSSTWRTLTPLPAAPIPITATSSSGLFTAIKDVVGSYQRVSCSGTWVAARDAQDAALIADVVGGTGPSTGYYASRTAANSDGFSPITRVAGAPCNFGTNSLPDSFEIRYFGVADTVTAGADHDGDGYPTGLEWVEGSDPTTPSWTYVRTTGPETIRARRIPAKDSSPFFDTLNTYPLPTDASDVPPVSGRFVKDTGGTDRMVFLTCDPTSDGAAIFTDSAELADTIDAMGRDMDSVLSSTTPGC